MRLLCPMVEFRKHVPTLEMQAEPSKHDSRSVDGSVRPTIGSNLPYMMEGRRKHQNDSDQIRRGFSRPSIIKGIHKVESVYMSREMFSRSNSLFAESCLQAREFKELSR